MAVEPLFMDSGGFYALVSPDSETHELAVEIMQAAAQDRRRGNPFRVGGLLGAHTQGSAPRATLG